MPCLWQFDRLGGPAASFGFMLERGPSDTGRCGKRAVGANGTH